jgi:elongation factor G
MPIVNIEIVTPEESMGNITGGRGSYTVEFSHYDLVSPTMQQKMVSQHKPDVEE